MTRIGPGTLSDIAFAVGLWHLQGEEEAKFYNSARIDFDLYT